MGEKQTCPLITPTGLPNAPIRFWSSFPIASSSEASKLFANMRPSRRPKSRWSSQSISSYFGLLQEERYRFAGPIRQRRYLSEDAGRRASSL